MGFEARDKKGGIVGLEAEEREGDWHTCRTQRSFLFVRRLARARVISYAKVVESR